MWNEVNGRSIHPYELGRDIFCRVTTGANPAVLVTHATSEGMILMVRVWNLSNTHPEGATGLRTLEFFHPL
jgi:hypothetical protein